jgi:hypothetical protein
MARRYSGNLTVYIAYFDDDTYKGNIVDRESGDSWSFSDLMAPVCGLGTGVAYDSPEAYDAMAKSAIGFGSYYTDWVEIGAQWREDKYKQIVAAVYRRRDRMSSLR